MFSHRHLSPYCEDHYYETAVGFCNSCSQRITADTPYRRVGVTKSTDNADRMTHTPQVENRPWHDSCLVCKRCGESVLSGYYEDQGGLIFQVKLAM